MKKLIGAAALAMTLAAAPAYATTTFAQFKQTNNTDTISFAAPGSLTSVAGSIVEFDFTDPMPPAVDGPISAFMILTASGAPYSGTLQFLRTSDNANLLTVTFTGAVLLGMGTAAGVLDSQPGGGTITFTSAFLDFSTTTAEDFALSFSGLSHAFGSATWTADSTGTFASDSRNQPGGGVPEPASWAMMITGFGGVGALLRRRRQLLTAFA